ncbi:hypothetical protein ACE6H2_010341 [Prunus campanulata]
MNVFYESSWPLFSLFTALEDFYEALNGPPQLKGWRLDSGDPCGESWAGLSCSGSSVIHLKLQGLNLSGYLSAQLYNMLNLKTLDVSSNYIVGEIPYFLPPNATHMNLSHNLLSGPVGNVFTSLQNLRELDLSYNNLTGSLTSSFGSLTNLTGFEKFTKGGILVIEDQKVKETDIEEEEPEVKDKRRKKAPSPPKVKVPAHEPDPTTDPEEL